MSLWACRTCGGLYGPAQSGYNTCPKCGCMLDHATVGEFAPFEPSTSEVTVVYSSPEAGPCSVCQKQATGPRVQPANVLVCNQCVKNVVIP